MDINVSTLIKCNIGHDSKSFGSLKVKQLNAKKQIQTLIPILLLLGEGKGAMFLAFIFYILF